MRRYVLIVAMLIGVCVVGYFVFISLNSAPAYTWKIQTLGSYRSSDQAPLNSISVQSDTTSVIYPLPGNYIGQCLTIEKTTEKLARNELSAIICTWADSGVEIGVYQGSSGKYIQLTERFGVSASTPFGTRDEFRSQLLLNLNTSE